MIYSLNDMVTFLPSLLQGALLTIAVSLLAFGLALVLGLATGLARISRLTVLRVVAGCYIQFIRGTPLLLQLFFIYYVLPYGGIVLTPFVSGLTGLTLNYAAYMAEVFRSGIQAIPKGQWEAGASVGMSRRLMLRRIILPQAMRVVVPPLGNEFIALIKTTSLASIIGFSDVLRNAQDIYYGNAKVIELLMVAAFWYLVVVSILSVGQAMLERRFARGFASATKR